MLVFQLASPPRPGALLFWTHGPPSVCLTHPSQACRGSEEGSTKNLGQSWQGVQDVEGGCTRRICG